MAWQPETAHGRPKYQQQRDPITYGRVAELSCWVRSVTGSVSDQPDQPAPFRATRPADQTSKQAMASLQRTTGNQDATCIAGELTLPFAASLYYSDHRYCLICHKADLIDGSQFP